MLYPQQNDLRNVQDLSGFWDFQLDPTDVGEEQGWCRGLAAPRAIAVPASWNEQFQDTHDYLGTAWYARTFQVSRTWQGQRVFLRFASANYEARVWLNGEPLGEHLGGHLPFAFEVTDRIAWGGVNTLAVRVNAELCPTRVPPGNVRGGMGGFFSSHPAASFDFYPYAGLQRPVTLFAVPERHIRDVTVVTDIAERDGLVRVTVVQSGEGGSGRARLSGVGGAWEADLRFAGPSAEATIRVPQARLWVPGDPYLYDLTVTLGDADAPLDRYRLDVGIRTVAVEGDRLLLNGRPIALRGFGRHEDFPVHGRGLNLPLIVKDHSMLKWMGANSYRTSHYPYSEEAMWMADREGILVVDETPAVGLTFMDGEEQIAARLAQVRQQVQELVARDKNHPSVIMWSLANEPMVGQGGLEAMLAGRGEPHPAAEPFFTELFDLARALDPTRLVTVEAPMGAGRMDWLRQADVICIHRYTGWYIEGGRLDRAEELLAKDLDQVYAEYGKPVAITEFGADTTAGFHSDPPVMWSEEYQVDMLRRYLDLAAERPWIVGLHVWNMADFRTAQGLIRANGLNQKGVLTRDRRPKMAAHFLRERWAGK